MNRVLFSLAIVSVLATSPSVQAQQNLQANSRSLEIFNLSLRQNKPLSFTPPPPPPNIGSPGKRKAAGHRGCQDISLESTEFSKQALTALVPQYSGSELVLGLTTEERPTLWFYVPYRSSSHEAQLVLKDGTNKTVHKIALTQKPGFLSVTLPPTTQGLEIGKSYHWYFNIFCKQDNQLVAYVDGNIQRQSMNPVFQTKLNKATPEEQVALYAANGIWYEALTTLANLRRSSPQNVKLASDWNGLLQSVGLQHLAQEKFVN